METQTPGGMWRSMRSDVVLLMISSKLFQGGYLLEYPVLLLQPVGEWGRDVNGRYGVCMSRETK